MARAGVESWVTVDRLGRTEYRASVAGLVPFRGTLDVVRDFVSRYADHIGYSLSAAKVRALVSPATGLARFDIATEYRCR